jgi:hypothetical protein
MYLKGVVENGQVKLNSNVRLPDGATVYMIIPDDESENNVVPLRSPRLACSEQAADFEMEVVEP